MKEILRSHSLGYVQGLQVAVEAQGIETALLDQQSLGFMGFAGRVRLMVANDADYERALKIVRELEVPAPARVVPPSWKVQRWGCAMVVLGFVVLGVGLTALEQKSRILGYVVVSCAVALFVVGIAVIMLGPRRDPPGAH